MYGQLVAPQGQPQFGLHLLAVHQCAGHGGGEEADLFAAIELGVIEGQIGALHDGVDIGAVLGQNGNAD